MTETHLEDEAAMLDFGCALSGELRAGDVVFFRGDLGAGKTTLVRGILQGLGHAGIVVSPTYTLVEPYNLGSKTVYHFDLYRLEHPGELENLGARDMMTGDGICLVEWPEKGTPFLPAPDMTVNIEYDGSGRRVAYGRDAG